MAGLVKAVDAKVADLKGKGLKAFVCGIDIEADDMKKFAEQTKSKMPYDVAVDHGGPPAYKLNPEAAVTVMVYNKGKKVVANFALKDTKELTSDKVAEIVKSLEKAL